MRPFAKSVTFGNITVQITLDCFFGISKTAPSKHLPLKKLLLAPQVEAASIPPNPTASTCKPSQIVLDRVK